MTATPLLFRPRPTVVEAAHWDVQGGYWPIHGGYQLMIRTLRGDVTVLPGDWIVRTQDGPLPAVQRPGLPRPLRPGGWLVTRASQVRSWPRDVTEWRAALPDVTAALLGLHSPDPAPPLRGRPSHPRQRRRRRRLVRCPCP